MRHTHELMFNGERYRVTLDGSKATIQKWKRGKGHWSRHYFWGAAALNAKELAAFLVRARDWDMSWEVRMASVPLMPRMQPYGEHEYV